MTAVPPHDDLVRHPWERLASQYIDGLRDGDGPALEDVTAKASGDADELRELLELATALEGLKIKREWATIRKSMPESFRFQKLGDCRIIRELGRGGMGVVLEAEQESLHRRVAVKVLPWRFPKASRLRERFRHEACLAAKLRHTHIVPVYQFGEEDGWCYYLMHLVPGVGLDRVITRMREPGDTFSSDEIRSRFSGIPESPPWTLRREAWIQFARIGMQVADGLRYAHDAGVLHRDIKPSNLLLDAKKSVWIADFGLAQAHDPQLEAGDGDIVGTMRYVAPEQLAGRPDARSDLYSLGMTLYELCTLRPAFDPRTRIDLVQQVKEVTPPPPHLVWERCPEELSAIIMRAIAKSPADRYQSAAELLNALLQFAQKHRERSGSSKRSRWWRWLPGFR
jgi:eukaryotic-like serine/threonine-protein kinase